MENRHRAHAHHQRVVDEVAHLVQRIGGPHAAHVDVILEVEFARRDVHREHRTSRNGACRLAVFVVRNHRQQPFVHRREYLSERHLRPLSLHRLHHADHLLPGHADFRPGDHFARLFGLRSGLPGCRLRALLRPALGAPSAATFDTLDLAGHGGFVPGLVGLLDRLAEVVQLAPRQPRQLLLGLRLADGFNRIFYLFVGVGDQLPGLLLGLFQNLLPLGADLRQLLGIVLLQLLDLAVRQTDAIALLLPVMLVAGDLAQLFLDIDVIRPGLLARRTDNILRKPDLAGDLHGERTARLAHFQPEQRPDVLHVEHHRAVGDALHRRGVILDIGVVGRDHAVTPPAEQTLEDRLGDGPADDRLGSRPELVDQHQRAARSARQHVLHVQQVRRIGRQVVVDRLLVADVDENALEDRQFRDLGDRNRKPALEHVLHDARGFQADRLAAGVGSRDDEDALATVELQIQRHDLAPRSPQRLLQQRVAGVFQHQPVVRREDRPHASVLRGPAALGAQHVDLGQVVARIGDQPRVGTDRFGKLREDAHHLAPLGVLQFAQFVVDLHHLDRFDVEGFARRRFVVDKAVQFAFVARRNRDHGLAVADRDLGVGIDDARPLGRRQHGLQPLGRLPFAFADGAADLLQGGRGVVLHLAEAVENAVDALHDLRKGRNAPRAGMEGRITLLAADDERDDAADCGQRPAQGHDLLHVEERTFDAQFGDDVIDVGVLAPGEIMLHIQQQAHFVGERQPPFDLARRGRKALRGEPLAGGAHGATCRDLLAEPVETYLLLECSRVNHDSKLRIKN